MKINPMPRDSVDIDGRRLAIYDNLIDAEHVGSIYDSLISNSQFQFRRVHDLAQEQFPSLVSLIDISSTLSANIENLLETITHCVREAGWRTAKLKKAQINVSYPTDNQRIHVDLGVDATAVFFPQPRWNPDWLGETLFYDEGRREVVTAVSPLPGRILVFDANIPHRGGVPSAACGVPRIVLAAKFSDGDKALSKLQEFLVQRGASKLPHSGRTLFDHLSGTYGILKRRGLPDYVCLAGLLHSTYGTETYHLRLEPPVQREELLNIAGKQTEALVYLFSIVQRSAIIKFAAREDGSEPVELPCATSGKFVRITALTANYLREIAAANDAEQSAVER